MDTHETSTDEGGREIRRGLQAGFASGLAAITCCVSPVVLVLLGVATAAEAVTLGDTLYYEYGWFFRAGGLALAAARRHTLPARAPGLLDPGRIHVPPDADHAGRNGRLNLRRSVLVHQVPGHLVRLAWRQMARTTQAQLASSSRALSRSCWSQRRRAAVTRQSLIQTQRRACPPQGRRSSRLHLSRALRRLRPAPTPAAGCALYADDRAAAR